MKIYLKCFAMFLMLGFWGCSTEERGKPAQEDQCSEDTSKKDDDKKSKKDDDDESSTELTGLNLVAPSVYTQNCVSCHGAEAEGVGTIFPSLLQSPAKGLAAFTNVIQNGQGTMPAYPAVTATQAEEIFNWVAGLPGAAAPGGQQADDNSGAAGNQDQNSDDGLPVGNNNGQAATTGQATGGDSITGNTTGTSGNIGSNSGQSSNNTSTSGNSSSNNIDSDDDEDDDSSSKSSSKKKKKSKKSKKKC